MYIKITANRSCLVANFGQLLEILNLHIVYLKDIFHKKSVPYMPLNMANFYDNEIRICHIKNISNIKTITANLSNGC